MTVRHFSLLLLMLYCSSVISADAQLSNRDSRKLRKAHSAYLAMNYDAAEKMLTVLCKKYEHDASLWNFMSEIQLFNYYSKARKDDISSLYKKLPPDAGPEERKRDSLSRIFLSKLETVRPSRYYLLSCTNTWRSATLKCPDAEIPSMLLRMFMLDPVTTDSSENNLAVLEFRQGQNCFKKQNYADAIIHYHQALQYDTSYYQARLYLGDAYFSNREYVSATASFRDAVKRKPLLQEPRKYLVDALLQMEAYEEARKEAIEALILYPEASLFLKLGQVAKAQHRSFDRHWTERIVFPNQMGDQPLNEKGDRDWMEYINGFSLIEKFCDKDGIIVGKNELTQTRYAEVYAWEYMLKKTQADKFLFARKMQQAGYLDCYVMLSQYHVDFNAQYQHFASRNKERLKAYLDLLMVL
ncbi:MAG: tetratricopeptide repeat protein [Bacteroidia bacterium]